MSETIFYEDDSMDKKAINLLNFLIEKNGGKTAVVEVLEHIKVMMVSVTDWKPQDEFMPNQMAADRGIRLSVGVIDEIKYDDGLDEL